MYFKPQRKPFSFIKFIFYLNIAVFLSCSLKTTGTYKGPPRDNEVELDTTGILELNDLSENLVDFTDLTIDTSYDFEEIEYPEGWLEGWRNRLKITVSPSDDWKEEITNFPLLIHIGSKSGRSNSDLTFIFSILASDLPLPGITITGEDGTSELFVEIEKWDIAGNEAFLWVKIPRLDPELDTIVYLYFDSIHPDNSRTVGFVGSNPAKEVWNDNGFEGVWHLNSVGGYQSVKDSTFHARHGTPGGGMVPLINLSAGIIGNAIIFDGVDDFICLEGNAINVNNWDQITIEAWFNAESIDDDRLVCKATGSAVAMHAFSLGVVNNDPSNNILRGRVVTGTSPAEQTNFDSQNSIEINNWYYGTLTWMSEEGLVSIFVNGLPSGSTGNSGPSIKDVDSPLCIGNINASSIEPRFFKGKIDEVRISNKRRSDTWILVSYLSGIDELISFGDLETIY